MPGSGHKKVVYERYMKDAWKIHERYMKDTWKIHERYICRMSMSIYTAKP